ncbi:hypothetical protein C8F04DRAFT_1203524 [Mycena alexandri]|uniref:Uncharacterized protein n=1 Tax=Mycena alexandri TaxID=1745969 RepID=A0AAD6WKY8_9AGAR|nr:hypothetical protein C8F04DRAFT_1203524 [Mycena alexandri]
MPESELEPKDLKTLTEQVVEISAEEEERILNLEECELKRDWNITNKLEEVLTLGLLGPISAIASRVGAEGRSSQPDGVAGGGRCETSSRKTGISGLEAAAGGSKEVGVGKG